MPEESVNVVEDESFFGGGVWEGVFFSGLEKGDTNCADGRICDAETSDVVVAGFEVAGKEEGEFLSLFEKIIQPANSGVEIGINTEIVLPGDLGSFKDVFDTGEVGFYEDGVFGGGEEDSGGESWDDGEGVLWEGEAAAAPCEGVRVACESP